MNGFSLRQAEILSGDEMEDLVYTLVAMIDSLHDESMGRGADC